MLTLACCMLAGSFSACNTGTGENEKNKATQSIATAAPTQEPEKLIDPGTVELTADNPIRTALEGGGIK